MGGVDPTVVSVRNWGTVSELVFDNGDSVTLTPTERQHFERQYGDLVNRPKSHFKLPIERSQGQ